MRSPWYGLLPALAEAFLKQEGYANVHRVDGAKEEESFIVGERNGFPKQIEIQAHGSKTAFLGLQSGLADIGMSSRAIKKEERQTLLPTLGDLTSNASEHVLALDGIAVIVHPSNPVKSLTLAQLADIFSGTITSWSAVGGQAGTIAVNARDNKSGTWDCFNEAVLMKQDKSLAANAERFEDSKKLSESVGSGPLGIGFIGLNYVGSNNTLALADTGVAALKPSIQTVKTEDYLLARRLYLYTAANPANPNVFKFIEFALSDAGQSVVESIGLVPVCIGCEKKGKETPEEASKKRINDERAKYPEWKKITENATAELPTRFRFRTGTSELDSRANRDIGRVSGIMQRGDFQGRSLILLGFADSKGSRTANCTLSRDRAERVKAELVMEGLTVEQVAGLCDKAPVASNDTPEGREKNRRVEVWVK